MSGGGWAVSVLALVVVLVLVVAAIAWIARELGSHRGHGSATTMSPRVILDRRLATGEIEPEQYEQLRRTLELPPESVRKSPPARPLPTRG
jgi:uncharacterized membrane protein